MSKFLIDALWKDLELGVLARSRGAFDACVAHHAKGDVDALIATASDAFAGREDNFKEALDAVWARVGVPAQRKAFNDHVAGRHADLVAWLYDVAVARSKDFATSRFFLDPAMPDRVWVQRQTSWDLAWRHDGEWKLKNLKAVRESKLPPLETLLTVRVAGTERANARLPRA